MAQDLLIATDRGLFCPEAGFYIDPWRPVEKAVVTHAHSDHAVMGCASYLCSATGATVLRARLGPQASITGHPFGPPVDIQGVKISLHPAGHILGSAQVRIEKEGRVWVVSGDYKTAADRTCERFEPVRCHVFISESTFGLPIYRWAGEDDVFAQINAWWRDNASKSRTSMIFAYSLGKAQRVLAGVDSSIGPLAVHGAVARMNDAYRQAGVQLPDAPHAADGVIAQVRGRGLVIAPPSALGSPWVRKFAAGGGGMSGAFVSGWMRVRGTRRRKAVDRGFVLSDHADWPGLLGAIKDTGAARVGITHGYIAPLARWLKESGIDSFAVPTRYTGEIGEEGAHAPDQSGDP